MLVDTQPIHDSVVAIAAEIDTRWRQVVLPEHLKRLFVCRWKEIVGYPAETARGQTKLYTSEDRAEYIADVAMAKAICAFPLRRALHEYRRIAIDLATTNHIQTFESEFGVTRENEPPSWPQWQAAIASSDLAPEEQLRLSRFLTDSNAFHSIKGIARGDFAAPAIIKAIGHRIDRFGIADQIAEVANEELYESVRVFVTTIQVAPLTTGSQLREAFHQAVLEAGFSVREG